jgi:phosphate uptake regulator
MSINVDIYRDNIDDVMFSVYYLGAQTITIFSKKALTKDVKSLVRKSVTQMSGTEISYEDEKKMTISVLLNISRVNLRQILYRIGLIIGLSISNIMESLDMNEININENEVDRLYHLMAKTVSMSLTDAEVLHSSKVGNISLIPSYFLICKKLENIGDEVKRISVQMVGSGSPAPPAAAMDFVKDEINRSMDHILRNPKEMFSKADESGVAKIYSAASRIRDPVIADYVKSIIRYVVDIQEETVSISFYGRLIRDNMI